MRPCWLVPVPVLPQQPRDLEQVHSFPQAGLRHPQNQSDNTFLLYPIGLKESSKKTGKTAIWNCRVLFKVRDCNFMLRPEAVMS